MKEIVRTKHIIDATAQSAGRLATQIAKLLMGKNKSVYIPNLDNGDFVIIENASKLKFTGLKLEQKKYRTHSQYPGGLKETLLRDAFAKSPSFVIRKTVYNMLPKNKLRPAMMKRLSVKN